MSGAIAVIGLGGALAVLGGCLLMERRFDSLQEDERPSRYAEHNRRVWMLTVAEICLLVLCMAGVAGVLRWPSPSGSCPSS